MSGPDNGAESPPDQEWGLSCADFLELTTDYLEGALSSIDETRFDQHLATCRGCSTVLQQLRYQIEISGQLREEDIDADSLARLLAAFADWRSSTDS